MNKKNGYEKAAGTGSAIGGAFAIGVLAGTTGSVLLAPAVAFVGVAAGIGAGLGALGKLIFN